MAALLGALLFEAHQDLREPVPEFPARPVVLNGVDLGGVGRRPAVRPCSSRSAAPTCSSPGWPRPRPATRPPPAGGPGRRLRTAWPGRAVGGAGGCDDPAAAHRRPSAQGARAQAERRQAATADRDAERARARRDREVLCALGAFGRWPSPSS